DSQYQELAEMLRAAISDVYPEFVAPMADFDEATVVAELGLYSQACSDTFLERARSDALAPSVSGLKRPLTDEEMAQAEEWVIERVTTTPDHRLRAWGRPDTTMPDHGPAVRRVWGARATPRNTVYRSLHSRADMVGGGLLMQLNVMTGGPFPPEVEALRDAAAASLRALRN
ncbi:MAG TPA: hypothetical protein QGH10_04520, partial [Armatimonadota bacterium]|nr:hypothetical protein [Armatimonadota bacterium]